MLPRLSPPGVQQFIDSVTFSESAVDNMTIENRMEIANRALRFARQQDAAQKKKGISETQEERCFKLHTLFSCVCVCVWWGWGGGTGRSAIFTTLQSYFPPRFGTLCASLCFFVANIYALLKLFSIYPATYHLGEPSCQLLSPTPPPSPGSLYYPCAGPLK